MTFIQPNKNNNVITIVLFLMVCLVTVAAFSLIVFYNSVVNFEHGVSGMKVEMKRLQAHNIEIQDKIFTLIDASKSQTLSSRRLVQDKNPAYFEAQTFRILPKWSYASQY